MPLILVCLLPVVSLAGVVTMPRPVAVDHPASDGEDRDISIATDPGDEALTGQQDDGGFEDRHLDEEPQLDEEPSYANPDLDPTESAPSVDGNASGAPGKSEEAPGHPRASEKGEGRGQETADESGRGPDRGRNNSGTTRN